ncbi:hypothetical protein U1Q18_037444 [Sarracenia purpurea var. burkii]
MNNDLKKEDADGQKISIRSDISLVVTKARFENTEAEEIAVGVAADWEGDYTESGEEEMDSDEDEEDEVADSGAKEMISKSKSLLSLAQVNSVTCNFNPNMEPSSDFVMSSEDFMVNSLDYGGREKQSGERETFPCFACNVFDVLPQPGDEAKNEGVGFAEDQALLVQVTQSSSSFNTKHGNVLMSKSVNGDKVYQCGVGKESIGFANKVFDGMPQPFSKSKDNVAGQEQLCCLCSLHLRDS